MATLYGILYAGNQLRYMDLTETKDTFMVNNPFLGKSGIRGIESLTLFNDDVVFSGRTYDVRGGYDTGEYIFHLFSDAKPVIRRSSSFDFAVHNGKLIDAGFEHLSLADRDPNRSALPFLISEEEMRSAGLSGFIGLGVDAEERLYAWAWKEGRNPNTRSPETVATVLVNLDCCNNYYNVGKTVLTYNKRGGDCTRGILLPGGELRGEDGQDYPFSALSTSFGDYLDLNGKKVEGSEAGKSNWWRDVRTISLEGSQLEVLCSDYVGRVFTALNIDLSSPKVVERRSIGSIRKEMDHTINRALPITDEKWHTQLMERGRQMRSRGIKEFVPNIPSGGRGCC
ncbi:MAG: hypothetical protein WCV90_08265 [Candidatus Woesearchaeota archaeon]|jgi:hypothetical protein